MIVAFAMDGFIALVAGEQCLLWLDIATGFTRQAIDTLPCRWFQDGRVAFRDRDRPRGIVVDEARRVDTMRMETLKTFCASQECRIGRSIIIIIIGCGSGG